MVACSAKQGGLRLSCKNSRGLTRPEHQHPTPCLHMCAAPATRCQRLHAHACMHHCSAQAGARTDTHMCAHGCGRRCVKKQVHQHTCVHMGVAMSTVRSSRMSVSTPSVPACTCWGSSGAVAGQALRQQWGGSGAAVGHVLGQQWGAEQHDGSSRRSSSCQRRRHRLWAVAKLLPNGRGRCAPALRERAAFFTPAAGASRPCSCRMRLMMRCTAAGRDGQANGQVAVGQQRAHNAMR